MWIGSPMTRRRCCMAGGRCASRAGCCSSAIQPRRCGRWCTRLRRALEGPPRRAMSTRAPPWNRCNSWSEHALHPPHPPHCRTHPPPPLPVVDIIFEAPPGFQLASASGLSGDLRMKECCILCFSTTPGKQARRQPLRPRRAHVHVWQKTAGKRRYPAGVSAAPLAGPPFPPPPVSPLRT